MRTKIFVVGLVSLIGLIVAAILTYHEKYWVFLVASFFNVCVICVQRLIEDDFDQVVVSIVGMFIGSILAIPVWIMIGFAWVMSGGKNYTFDGLGGGY